MTATARDGAGVARGPDGRVVFVEGALPGELVRAEIVRDDRRWSRARVVAVLEPSPDRIAVDCVARIEGCGGCDLLHVETGAQLRLKTTMVLDQLHRAGIEPPMPAVRTLDHDAGRTTVRAAVVDARAGFRRARSHEVVVPDECGAVDPLAAELLVEGRYPGAREVTIRVGSRTGDRLVVVDGDPSRVVVPDDVVVVGRRQLDEGRRVWIHEEIAGHRLRISARSFFQNRPAGAEALVAEVAEQLQGVDGDPVIDAYAGVGLFSVCSVDGRRVVVLERSSDAVADARANLAGRRAKVLRLPVERWRASPAPLIVADPARQGLGDRGVTALTRARPERLVLVSCDASAFAADARRLSSAGLELRRWTLVDLFPDTSHVETVAVFEAVS